jgi:hypothetical protein
MFIPIVSGATAAGTGHPHGIDRPPLMTRDAGAHISAARATSSPSTLTHTRRWCRRRHNADCADLRIVPTLIQHALRSRRFRLATSAQSCSDAWLHFCASAPLPARRTCLLPDPRRRGWSEHAGRMGFRPRAAVPNFAPQPPCLTSVRTGACAASRIVPTSPACNPVPPGRPRTTSAQSRGRRTPHSRSSYYRPGSSG